MDILQREGHYPLPPGAPETLGVEFSGTIVEVGEGCQPKWKLDDEVIGLASGVSKSVVRGEDHFWLTEWQGAYAEYVRLPQTNLMRKPNHLSWEEAASIPENFLTGTSRNLISPLPASLLPLSMQLTKP